MTDESQAAKPLDSIEIATQIGHGAAVNVLVSLAPPEVDPTFDPQCWPSFGNVRIQDEERDVVGALGRYVCERDTPVAGETLYRKAAELGLHDGDPDGWRGQPSPVRLAYELFIGAAWHAYARLQDSGLPEPLPPRPKPELEDTIYEKSEGLADQDPDAAAALKAMGTLSAEERAAVAATPETGAEVSAEPAADAPADAALSVGDRPIDMAKQVKRRGGKRTRSAS